MEKKGTQLKLLIKINNNNMLKKLYITVLVSLICMGNVLILQQTGKQSSSPILPGVLGAFGTNNLPVTPQSQPVVSPTSTINTPASTSTSGFSQSLEVKLDGNGCTANVFPNSCKVVSSRRESTLLKECNDKSWDKCNFYTYTLGKKTADNQYIFQTYEEIDTLVDILSYDLQSGQINLVKTVLLQKGDDLSDPLKIANQDYISTFDQYKN